MRRDVFVLLMIAIGFVGVLTWLDYHALQRIGF